MRRRDAIDILSRHEPEIRARGVTRLALFGSTARDEAGPESDVDLLVDFEPPANGSNLSYFGLPEFFSRLLGREAEVVERHLIKPFLKDTILGEALEIFPEVARPPYYTDGVPVVRRSPRQALEDIRSDLDAIESFVAGRSLEDFRRDGMLSRAIQRAMEITSEASRKLPTELTDAHPDVPWHDIRAIGNVLRHAYPDIDTERIWTIATREIHPLRAAITAMITRLDQEEGRR